MNLLHAAVLAWIAVAVAGLMAYVAWDVIIRYNMCNTTFLSLYPSCWLL